MGRSSRSAHRHPVVRAAIAATALAVVASLVTPIGPASAAPADVVISELMYGPISELDADEFLEIANPGTTAVDLSGWTLTGVTHTFATGTTIPAGGRLVLAKDAARFQATYGFAPSGGVWTSGSLSNGGEAITLRDASTAVIDTVTYDDVAPWPVTADELGKSLELIAPTLDNTDYLNWASSTAAAGHTAGAANSVAGSGIGPRITAVAATPNPPAANAAVTVTATVTGQTSSPVVEVTRDFAAVQNVTMNSAGGDSWTATFAGVAAGHLIRYRVRAANAARTSFFPRVDDSSPRSGLVAPNGITSAIPVLEWFIADSDYNAITSQPTVDIERQAVLAYAGTVFDNVTVNIRGAGSQTAPKPNWKFELPKNYDLTLPGLVEPVDEFAMQSDWSDRSHGRPIVSWDSYQVAGNVNAQLFPVRTQKNSAFLGLYTYVDLFDGTWRGREGYEDTGDQFFKASHGAFDATRPLVEYRFEKKFPGGTGPAGVPNAADFAPIQAFLDGVDLSGTAERNFLLANADIPQMLNYAAVTAIVEHHDSLAKNFYLSQEGPTGRWEIIPWDLDHTFGNGCCGVNSSFVTPAEPGDQVSELMAGLLAVPEWRQMYFRRLRTLVNEILAPGRLEAVYDAKVGPAQATAALDFAAWPHPATTFASQRTSLFNAIAARRTVFNNDSRLPAQQSAAPNMVINEIQHSPAAGSGAQFVELHNPSGSEAVDLSGWQIAEAGLVVQPGTVILPGGRMVFARNDPTFRATYGTSVFVGGRFDTNLGTSGALTLTRANGSVADAVTYGGAGWPQPTAGQSLELTNPAADNSNPANWALSPAAGGTPGAPNTGTVATTAPGEPVIGNATAGNGSATARWSAPVSDGGSAVTGYQVRVVNNANNQVGALRPAGATATSLVVTGLTNGTAYRFQVSATNGVGTGGYSALSNTITPSAATVPGAPVIGNATRGTAGAPITAIARWTPPATTGGSPVTGYLVTALRMSSSAANATVLGRTDSPVLGQGIRQRQFTLTADNYRFEVVAINAVGTGPASARSNNIVPR